jgi:hypothetical protein
MYSCLGCNIAVDLKNASFFKKIQNSVSVCFTLFERRIGKKAVMDKKRFRTGLSTRCHGAFTAGRQPSSVFFR